MVENILYIIAAYLIGSVPFGYIAGRLNGIDLREHGNGCGDIVFDYTEESGERVPRGIIGVAHAAEVHTLLRDAIDAAYNASPWSV